MINQKDLKILLSYDPDTGIFRWIKKMRRIAAGTEAGCARFERKPYYRHIKINRQQYRAHRLAFLYMTGSFPENQVDHIDGNGLNNKWVNLRNADHVENGRNQSLSKRNKSGRIGVSWHKTTNRWCAGIRVNSKRIYLGYFKNFQDAVRARSDAEEKYGFHANHGRSA